MPSRGAPGPFNEFEFDVTDLPPPAGEAVVRVVCASEDIALRPRRREEVYAGGPPLDVPVLLHLRGRTRDIRGVWREVYLELRADTHLAELSIETGVSRASRLFVVLLIMNLVAVQRAKPTKASPSLGAAAVLRGYAAGKDFELASESVDVASTRRVGWVERRASR